jgi:hypothetical protein
MLNREAKQTNLLKVAAYQPTEHSKLLKIVSLISQHVDSITLLAFTVKNFLWKNFLKNLQTTPIGPFLVRPVFNQFKWSTLNSLSRRIQPFLPVRMTQLLFFTSNHVVPDHECPGSSRTSSGRIFSTIDFHNRDRVNNNLAHSLSFTIITGDVVNKITVIHSFITITLFSFVVNDCIAFCIQLFVFLYRTPF